MSTSISQFFNRYKIFYIIVWMIVSFLIMFTSYDYNTPIFPQWIGFLILTGLAIPVCNYAAYTLTPNYLYNRRVWRFIVYLFLANTNYRNCFIHIPSYQRASFLSVYLLHFRATGRNLVDRYRFNYNKLYS